MRTIIVMLFARDTKAGFPRGKKGVRRKSVGSAKGFWLRIYEKA